MFWWKLDILLVAITALFSWLFQQRRPKKGTKSTNNWKTYLPPDLFAYFLCFFSWHQPPDPGGKCQASRAGSFVEGTWCLGAQIWAFWPSGMGGQLAKCWFRERFGFGFSNFDQKPSFCVFFFGIDGCLQLSFFFKFFVWTKKTCDFSRFLLIIHWWRIFYEAILKQIWGYGLYGNLQARGFLGEAFWGFLDGKVSKSSMKKRWVFGEMKIF